MDPRGVDRDHGLRERQEPLPSPADCPTAHDGRRRPQVNAPGKGPESDRSWHVRRRLAATAFASVAAARSQPAHAAGMDRAPKAMRTSDHPADRPVATQRQIPDTFPDRTVPPAGTTTPRRRPRPAHLRPVDSDDIERSRTSRASRPYPTPPARCHRVSAPRTAYGSHHARGFPARIVTVSEEPAGALRRRDSDPCPDTRPRDTGHGPTAPRVLGVHHPRRHPLHQYQLLLDIASYD